MDDINLEKELIYKGYWWLPSDPSKKVAGILTYVPHKSIELELIGTLYEEKIKLAFFDRIPKEMIIYGKNADNKDITLINCLLSGGKYNLSCEFPLVRYECKYIIIGKHLKSYDNKCFSKSHIDIPILNFWCPPTCIDKKDSSKTDSLKISIKLTKNVNTVQVNPNTKISLFFNLTYKGDPYSPLISQKTSLKISKSKKASINEIIGDIFLFEQFLSLATLQSIKCSRIVLFDKTVYDRNEPTKKYYLPIYLIYVQNQDKTISRKEPDDFLFTYDLISANYADVITKWYNESEEFVPIRAHLISSMQYKTVFNSPDFLIVIQALEGFYTRFRDPNRGLKKREISLNEKIGLLVKEFSDIDKLKNDNINLDQVVDSRHYFSHLMPKEKKPNTIDGIKLYELTVKLRKLLICCVLDFIGFDHNKINEMLNSSYNYLLS